MEQEFIHGLFLQAGLITAMGPQNLFVLASGLGGRRPFQVAAACTACDALLIAIGLVVLPAAVSPGHPAIRLLRVLGALVIGTYAAKRFAAAVRLPAPDSGRPGKARFRGNAVQEAIGLSLLNPAVYLDAVGLIGSAAAGLPPPARHSFGAGAVTGSALWFFGLVCVGRLLGRTVAPEMLGRRFEALSGILLTVAALQLLWGS